jgi:C-terminal processing protease CtpA/Prc
MARCTLALGALLAVLAPIQGAPPANEDKGTYLGVLFSPVPEALYAHLPDLPRDQGVLVTLVLPDSPAARAGLQRHDIVLQYDQDKIRDCEHFAKRIHDDTPDRTVKLVLVRGGRPLTAEVTLTRGPVLHLPPSNRARSVGASEVPRGTAKSNGPGAVTVTVKPIDGGQLKVTFEYYHDSGRLQTVSFAGSTSDIESDIQKLPTPVQPLARVAFQRICQHHLQQKSANP